jgi:hypothetical protein
MKVERAERRESLLKNCSFIDEKTKITSVLREILPESNKGFTLMIWNKTLKNSITLLLLRMIKKKY